MKRIQLFCSAALVIVLAASAASAGLMAVHPTMVPVKDLLARLEKYAQAHPDSAEAYYRIGRVHYLACQQNLEKIGVEDLTKATDHPDVLDATNILLDRFEAGRPVRTPWTGVGIMVSDTDEPLEKDAMGSLWGGGITATAKTALTPAQVTAHLEDAIGNLEKSIKLDPQNARAHLALACALEDYAKNPPKGGVQGGDPMRVEPSALELRQHAAREYLAAYNLAIVAEGKYKFHPLEGLHSLVSYEAGKSYLRLIDLIPMPVADPGKDVKARDDAAAQVAARNQEIVKSLAAFEQLPHPMVD